MKILSLDVAEFRTGWAAGESGSKPVYGSAKIRQKGERTEEAVARFAEWLDTMINDHRPRLVFAEDYLPAGAMKGFTTSDVRDGAILLAGAMRATCALQGDVEVRTIAPATIRKHFCGRAYGEPIGKESSRDATKRMVVERAQMLGYIPKDCFDHDVADAIAGFDFASSHYARAAGAFALTEKR
jgi:hypothetical protein